MLRIALTCDDAPTIAAAPGVARDPDRMDRLRVTLQRNGVRHCVAFVIGSHVDDPGPLSRWLAAGYELGNHTWAHEGASATERDAFLASVDRCDALLTEHGAWADGQTKWFRFPYLDYGASGSAQREIAEHIASLGYTMGHATVDLYDDRFERALGTAVKSNAETRTMVIGMRYRNAARNAMRQARARLGPEVPQVPYFHFGEVSDRFLGDIVREWVDEGSSLCSLDAALAHPDLQRDEGTGLILGRGRPSLVQRLAMRGQGLSNRVDPTGGRWLGPPWPRIR